MHADDSDEIYDANVAAEYEQIARDEGDWANDMYDKVAKYAEKPEPYIPPGEGKGGRWGRGRGGKGFGRGGRGDFGRDFGGRGDWSRDGGFGRGRGRGKGGRYEPPPAHSSRPSARHTRRPRPLRAGAARARRDRPCDLDQPAE